MGNLYNFKQFNEKHIGEDYIFVWNDGKQRPYSFEAYLMVWDGHTHSVFDEAFGKDEREALYNLNDNILFRFKKLNEYNHNIQKAFEECDKKSLLVN